MKSNFVRFNEFASQEYERVAKANKMVGNPSPEFEYENYKGGKTKLSDLKGKYVYIDLWATWCGPCRAEIPFLQKIEEKYHGKNIEFVSISIDKAKDNDKWKKFVTDKNLGGVQLFADKDWESEFVKSYGVNGIPRFILIDPNGIILNPEAARPSSAELQTQLDILLK
jgi:thiol-disulfide isomerase/thioredoxin